MSIIDPTTHAIIFNLHLNTDLSWKFLKKRVVWTNFWSHIYFVCKFQLDAIADNNVFIDIVLLVIYCSLLKSL